MLGDYFTVDLLSGSPSTSMIGNLINNSVLTPGQTGQAGAFVLIVLVVSVIPMFIYVRSTRSGDGHRGRERPMSNPVAWWRNPWRKPWGLLIDHRRSTSPGRCCRCWSPSCSRSTPAARG